MKSNLIIPGLLISISLLTFSCTNDDYEIPESQGSHIKAITKDQLKKEINTITIDSTIVNTQDDGEPNNPKPPRQ